MSQTELEDSPMKQTGPVSQMSPSDKRSYIDALIEHLESQKKYSLFFITFGIGCIGFTLDKAILVSNPVIITNNERLLLAAAVVCIALATIFFGIWHAMLHVLRVGAIEYLVTLDVGEARRVHHPGARYFRRWGWIVVLATIFLSLGLIGYVSLILKRVL